MRMADVVDPSYEYNAPQFVDFQDIDKAINDENVDDYFNYDHEAGQPVSIAESFSEDVSIYEDATGSHQHTPRSDKKKTPTGRRSTPRRNAQRSCRSTPGKIPSPAPGTGKENDVPEVLSQKMGILKKVTDKEMPQIKPVLSNICTDLSSWRKGSKSLAPPSQHTMKAKRKSLKGNNGAVRVRKSLEEPRQMHQSPAAKKHKRSTSVQKAKVPTAEEVLPPPRMRTRTISVEKKFAKPADPTPTLMTRRGRTKSVEVVPTRNRNTSSLERKKPTPQATGPSKTHRRAASLNNTPFQTRSTPVNSAERKPNSSRRSGPAGTRSKKASLNGSAEGVRMLKPMLTMPSTPSFMKRKPISSATSNMKSTEEMELEQIKELRKDLARKRKMAEDSYKTAQTAGGYVPKHSTVKPTKPVDLHFATDDRIKEHPMATRQGTSKDFVAMLRHNSIHEGPSKPLAPTKPVPFNFAERKRKRDEEEAAKAYQFQSVAEKMIAFARKTPDRFRTRGKNQAAVLTSGPPPKLTVPKTPNLESRKRHRPQTTKSQMEIEEEEAEQIKRYKFHAQPVNENIMKGPVGVPKVQAKELTKPMEFDLEIYRRLQHRRDHTTPTEEKEEQITFHNERTVLHNGIPFMPKYEHKVTEPRPFSFDEKDRARFSKKDEKIHQILEEERRKASEFKARPLKDLSPQLPPKRKIPSTNPQPFDLAVENRGHQKAEDWSHKIEEELKLQRAAANFKARPNAVAHKKPFIPTKSTKPLTDSDEWELATDRRAEEREQYEKYRHEKEVEFDLQKKAMERMKEEEERRQVEEMRASAVHKAQPVKKFKRVEVKPSGKPLTQPKTPRFSTRLKSRV